MTQDKDFSRREALKIAGTSALATGLSALGITPAAAQQKSAPAMYSKEALVQRTQEILDYTTSQAFLNELNAVLNAPKDKQLSEAARRFEPKRLNTLGLQTPPKTRISTRVFDEADGRSRILGPRPDQVRILNVSGGGKLPSKADLDALINKRDIAEYAGTTATSVCVCVGGGACVGIGGGS